MSKISTIYDAVLVEVASILHSKTRIPNAYDLQNNPISLMRDGWGLRISNSALFPSPFCNVSQDRVFSIVLTEEVYRLDTSTSGVDAGIKSMLEDAKVLIDGMMASNQIGVGSSIDKIEFLDASGVQLMGTDKSHFISMDVNFSIVYSESI